MPAIKVGYAGQTKTPAELDAWVRWARLHPEMRRRVMALIVDSGYVVGVGGAFRFAADQVATFTARYRRTDAKTSIWWDGSYWVHVSGAAAAVPGDSYHEPCLGANGAPDDSDATGFCVAVDTLGLTDMPDHSDAFLARYGLRNFDSEPWHVQPVEWPAARKDWDAHPIPLRVWSLPRQPAPAPPPPPTPVEDDMPRLIQPANDVAVFLLDGLTATWVADGHVLTALQAAGIVPAGITTVDRVALRALVLAGEAPTTGAYAGAPATMPGRTKATDFAAWRP